MKLEFYFICFWDCWHHTKVFKLILNTFLIHFNSKSKAISGFQTCWMCFRASVILGMSTTTIFPWTSKCRSSTLSAEKLWQTTSAMPRTFEPHDLSNKWVPDYFRWAQWSLQTWTPEKRLRGDAGWNLTIHLSAWGTNFLSISTPTINLFYFFYFLISNLPPPENLPLEQISSRIFWDNSPWCTLICSDRPS